MEFILETMKYLILFLMVLLFHGCGIKKKNSRSHEQLTDLSELDISKETHFMSDSLFKRLSFSQTEFDNLFRIIVRSFDTSLPVDTSTGTPPLSNEIILENSRKETTTDIDQVSDSVKRKNQTLDINKSKLNINQVKEGISKQKSGTSTMVNLLASIGAIYLCLVVLWVVKKYVAKLP